MAQILCKITLDMDKGYSDEVIVAKEGDHFSRFVRVELLHEGQRLLIGEDTAVVLNVKRADGERASFSGSAEGDGQLLLPIGGWMLEVAGTSECDVTVTDGDGRKLTSPTFCVVCEDAVCRDGELTENGESITAEFLQAGQLFELLPEWLGSNAAFYPMSNRSYQIDLSGEEFRIEDEWQPIRIVMPEIEDIHKTQKIFLNVHAPQNESDEYPILSFDANVLFQHGKTPIICQPNTCILCVFAPKAEKWLVTYGTYGENASDPLDAVEERLSAEIEAVKEVLAGGVGISYHICTADEITNGAPNFAGTEGVIYFVPIYDITGVPSAMDVIDQGYDSISRSELFTKWVWVPVTQEYNGFNQDGSKFSYNIEGHFERVGPELAYPIVYESAVGEGETPNYYVAPNQMVSFDKVHGAKNIYLRDADNGKQNEWCFVIVQYEEPDEISLPEGIEWIGGEPIFPSWMATECRLFYVGSALKGIAVVGATI